MYGDVWWLHGLGGVICHLTSSGRLSVLYIAGVCSGSGSGSLDDVEPGNVSESSSPSDTTIHQHARDTPPYTTVHHHAPEPVCSDSLDDAEAGKVSVYGTHHHKPPHTTMHLRQSQLDHPRQQPLLALRDY